MNRILTGLTYAGVVLLAVCFTWGIHELAHWLAYKALGYDAVMTLNTVSLQNGEIQREWHEILISAAGPVITIVQALVVYRWLAKRGWMANLYPLLLVPFYMRLLAGVMNVINLNDEGRISHFLGIGDYTLSIAVCALLGALVFKISRKYKPGWKFQVPTVVLMMLFGSVLVLADQFWHIVLIRS